MTLITKEDVANAMYINAQQLEHYADTYQGPFMGDEERADYRRRAKNLRKQADKMTAPERKPSPRPKTTRR